MTGPASPDPPPPVDLREVFWREMRRTFSALIGEIEAAGEVPRQTTWIRWLRALQADAENAEMMAMARNMENERLRAELAALRADLPEPPVMYLGRSLSQVCATCGKTWGRHAQTYCEWPATHRTFRAAAAPQRQEPPTP